MSGEALSWLPHPHQTCTEISSDFPARRSFFLWVHIPRGGNPEIGRGVYGRGVHIFLNLPRGEAQTTRPPDTGRYTLSAVSTIGNIYEQQVQAEVRWGKYVGYFGSLQWCALRKKEGIVRLPERIQTRHSRYPKYFVISRSGRNSYEPSKGLMFCSTAGRCVKMRTQWEFMGRQWCSTSTGNSSGTLISFWPGSAGRFFYLATALKH